MACRTLTLRREGEFTIKTVPGTPHCGVGEWIDVRYRFVVLCEPSLDDRGFLFDQLSVQAYFDKKKECRSSCEKVAMRSLRDLLSLIRRENPKCRIIRASLVLTPYPFQAEVQVDWRADKIAA